MSGYTRGTRLTKRRLLARAAPPSGALTAGMLTVGAAACGIRAGTGGSGDGGHMPKEPVRLSYLTWVGKDQVELIQQAANVLKHARPTVGVEVTSIPHDQMVVKTTTMTAAGTPPDILETNDKIFIDFVYRHVLSDLAPLVNRDRAAVNLDDFYSVYIAGMKWQGKLFGLPDFTGTSVAYYNKKLFDDAGMAYPNYDWTWHTLEERGRRLLQRYPEGSGTFIVQPFVQDIRWLPYYLWTLGGTMYEGWGPMAPDKTVVRVYSPTNVKALQQYVDWVAKYHFLARPGEASDWRAEQLAMVFSGRDSVPGYRRIEWMSDHAAMTLPPKGTAPRRSRTTTRGAGIPNGVKYREASWEAIKFLTSKSGLEITIAGGYTQAVRKSAEPAFVRTLAPFEDAQVYQDSQRFYTDPVPNHARWVEQEIIVRDHIQAAVKGERSPDQALRELQAALELSFKQAVQEARQ